MPLNMQIFQGAEMARDQLLRLQQREITRLYQNWADEVGRKAKEYERKQTASGPIQAQQLRELQRMVQQTGGEVSTSVEKLIVKNLYTVSDSVVKQNTKWLKSIGFSNSKTLDAAFSHVPQNVVNRIVTGQIYDSGWSLSQRIWSANQQNMQDAYEIVAGGVAQNKPMYEIAKDLEQYVTPGAKKPWNLTAADGRKIYPRQVDYNAQRLGRTLVQHGYQQSFVETTKDNPFISSYFWDANGSRVCELCMERSQTDSFGLGPGVFPKDQLPLDHPNGMCVMVPNVADNLVDQLANWFNEPDGTYPEIDNYANQVTGSAGFGSGTWQGVGGDGMGIHPEPFNGEQWMEALWENDNNRDMFKSWGASWETTLTDAERQGVAHYTTGAYRDMNRYLRGSKSTSSYMEQIKGAQRGLNKSGIYNDVIVRRASDSGSLTGLFKTDDFNAIVTNPNKYIGMPVTDKGFMSTSPLPHGGFSADQVEYVIKVPKNAKAAYVAGISDVPDEYELLINAGSSFEVKAIEHVTGHQRTVLKVFLQMVV